MRNTKKSCLNIVLSRKRENEKENRKGKRNRYARKKGKEIKKEGHGEEMWRESGKKGGEHEHVRGAVYI